MDYLARASAIVAEFQNMRRELEALRLYQGSLRQGIREASEYATEVQAIVQENKERALALTSPLDQNESSIEDGPAEASSLSDSDDEGGSWGSFYASRGDDKDSEDDSDGHPASDSDSYAGGHEVSDNEASAVESINDGVSSINTEDLPDPYDFDLDIDFDINEDLSDTDVETPFEDVYFTRRPHLVHPLTSTEAFFASSPPLPDERSLDWEDNAENIAPGMDEWDWQYDVAERAWNRGWRAIHARRPSYPEVPVLGEIVNGANSARVTMRERRERDRPIPRPTVHFR